MRKKILSVLILTALAVQLSGCGENGTEENDEEISAVMNIVETQSGITITIPEIPDTVGNAGNTNEPQNTDITADTIPQTVSSTAVAGENGTDTAPDTPEWNETAVTGELYVNTDYIYSRIYAIQGSEKVKQYRLNDKVTITAETDTDYYKLSDGTFIHKDYLSESETEESGTVSSEASFTSAEPQTAASADDDEPQVVWNTSAEAQNTDTSASTDAPTESGGTSEWNETAASGVLYVNTDYIYSRIYAVQGSEKVKQYRLNDKVTVAAKTDTGYYKLNDGTFIHEDYLSENEIALGSESGQDDYRSVTQNGYVIERINGITYVDGIMIANKTYTLPSSYDPGIIKEASDALAEMQAAAAAEGLSLYVVSGYRSYYTQQSVYAGWVNRDGTEKADTYSSRPGHSDHQTGYTFDLNSLEQSFAYTAEGIWLAENCAEFGFIIRYPEGKEMYTGYIYEPWHVRYVGVEKARAITESGLSLEEYYGISSDYGESEE